MDTTNKKADLFFRDSPWWIVPEDPMIPLADGQPLPMDCYFPTDGIVPQSPDAFIDSKISLGLEVPFIIQHLLCFLVDFHQVRKLGQFLLGFCDGLQYTILKASGKVEKCQFQLQFTRGITVEYSTHMCGCILWWDLKMDTFHKIHPQAIDSLRRMIDEVWPEIKDLPVWETVAETEKRVVYRRRNLK